MKIIDKTPLLNEKGELGIVQRIQGMLKFGPSWPNELEAQKAIISFFDKNLEKGYTLIRNMTLGASDIMVPLILLGPTGIHVIHVTYLRGRYEAKGDTWNEESGNGYKPAAVNLIQRTTRMAKAVKMFIERQGVKLPVEIEPVLIAGNPGLHIESVRPAIKVMMIDGIKSFVSTLATGRPVLKLELVHELTDRIVDPRMPKKEAAAPTPASEPRSAAQEPITQPPGQEVSRARAIFSASEEAKPINPSDFDFAMVDEEAAVQALSSSMPASTPAAAPVPARKRFLGMTPFQLVIIAALAAAFLCILAVFAYLIFFNPTSILP